MDRTPETSRLRRVALWVTAAAVFLIFAFQLLSPSTPVYSILEDLTGTNSCDVYKPTKRVAIVGQSVCLLIHTSGIPRQLTKWKRSWVWRCFGSLLYQKVQRSLSPGEYLCIREIGLCRGKVYDGQCLRRSPRAR